MTTSEPTGSGVAQPRRRLGKYELVEQFDRGGMATVYKAYDPALDRYVAIKQIAAHLADDPRFIERFRHEAQVLAKLGDEATHIVSIYELVEDEAGGLFIVMEYVEGRTLETFLASAPISPAAAIKLMAQIARGLRAVHNKGIVHRDVKPLNTIITPQGRVKITDFGLAAHGGGDTSMNMGTTKYMAPELFKGGTIDGRADLYSLGFMMYELLCPVDRFNEVLGDVLADERSEPLRWMSWHADPARTVPPLVEVNDRVPKRLSLIVERLMAKDADQRMYSAEELLQELKLAFGRRSAGTTAVARDLSQKQMEAAASAPGPAARRRPGTGDTAPLPGKANWRKRLVIIGAAAAALLVGLVVAVVVAGAPARRLAAQAKQDFEEAETLYADGKYEAAAQKYGRYLEWAGPRFPEHPKVIDAQMKAAMAEAHVLRDQRKFDEAEERLQEADRLGMDRRRVRSFRGQMAAMKQFYELLARADEKAGERLYDEALKLLDEADRLDPGRADAAQKRTEIQYQKLMYEGQEALEGGDWTLARARFEGARRLRATPEVEARLRHITANERFYQALSAGQAALSQGDFAAAVNHLQQALQLRDDKKVANLLTDARYGQKMQEARALEARQAFTDALTAYQVAQGIKDTAEVRTRIQAVETEIKVADLTRQADQARAEGHLDKAVELLTQVAALKPSPELEARITDLKFNREMERGRAFERESNWKEALKAYTEAKRIKNVPEVDRAIREVEQRQKYETLLTQGENLFKSELFEQALEVFRDAQKVRPGEEIEGKIADCKYEIFLRAGQAQEKAGDYNGAYANYQAALKLKPTEDVKKAVDRVKAKLET